jgi:hypothetical protein
MTDALYKDPLVYRVDAEKEDGLLVQFDVAYGPGRQAGWQQVGATEFQKCLPQNDQKGNSATKEDATHQSLY